MTPYLNSWGLLSTIGVLIMLTIHIQERDAVGIEVDNPMLGNSYVEEGDSITLTCDLRNADAFYISFMNSADFLTYGPYINDNLREDIARRLGVTCNIVLEACYLTINPVLRSDTGVYTCGIDYRDGTRINYLSGELFVENPPAPVSPSCALFDQDYKPVNMGSVNIGDSVAFGCNITGGEPGPTEYMMYIAREGVAITPVIKLEASASFSYSYTLSEEDADMSFSCVLSHSTLSQKLTCLLLYLERSDGTPAEVPHNTTPRGTTVLTRSVNAVTPLTSSEADSTTFSTMSTGTTARASNAAAGSSNQVQLLHVIVAILSALFAIAMVFVLTMIVVFKRRNKVDVSVDKQGTNQIPATDTNVTDEGIENVEMHRLDNESAAVGLHEYASIKTTTKNRVLKMLQCFSHQKGLF